MKKIILLLFIFPSILLAQVYSNVKILPQQTIMNAIARDTGGVVAMNTYSDQSIMAALGERESMGTSVSGEDIWRGNELSPAPTSHTRIPLPSALGEQMTIVSESANDSSIGTGVRTVTFHLLDSDGNEFTETVTLNGTTEVDTIATNIRFVNDMHSSSVGSDGSAAGHIKVYKKGSSGLVYNMIHIGGNKSLVPVRMVPLGKTLSLKGWHLSEAQGKRVAIRLRSTDVHGTLLPGVFIFKDTNYIKAGSSGYLECNLKVPELSIIKISGWPDQAGAEVSVSWWGILSDNN